MQWQSFDPMASSNMTFDGGQVKVRSNEVTFSNKCFNIKHMFLAQISSGFHIWHQFASAMRRTPKIASPKNGFISFSLYIRTYIITHHLKLTSYMKLQMKRFICFTSLAWSIFTYMSNRNEGLPNFAIKTTLFQSKMGISVGGEQLEPKIFSVTMDRV